ncbi:PIN domain-containing protein [Kamptonema sp. UHCC 0994]|uniref:type II toxin-antitoxin system VapC family toxin n=1 Tax=Kamptonema sp. UHCC 0994 TaxID=3031329 RepID=UPI0023B8CAFA|nr:PIN domain-containing protein [Kamptonema sp. UHCC 0994]MDF0552381.1 PIN domain-containing protein [Kamptonema sp. UHCC 0994]
MMSNQVYNIQDYRFSSSDSILFDANVWLYIYGPQGESLPRLRSTYHLALRKIRGAKIPIFIDVLVLSEFINASARLVYNDLPQGIKPQDFKTFRQSNEFNSIASQIAKDARRILKKCERIDSGFESADLGGILSDYAVGDVDFNDKILAELCKAKNLKLVTHDADFKGEDLTVITANRKFFN